MANSARSGTAFTAGMFLVTGLATAALAQSPQYPKPTELPNPYRLVEGWPTLPTSMNGGRWGEVIRLERFIATATSGFSIAASTPCRPASPPASDAAMPIRRSCNLIRPASCSRASAPACSSIRTGSRSTMRATCGSAMSTTRRPSSACRRATPTGAVLGQEVLKLDQNGKVLMMLGKMGVGGKGTDTFDRPTGVGIGANGDIFVSDGHGGNVSHNARVFKFSKDGRFIKTWGHEGSAPGRFR